MTSFRSKWLEKTAGGAMYAPDKTDKRPPIDRVGPENPADKTDKRAFVSFVGSSPAPSGENRAPDPPPSARPIDPTLAARVDAALRRGQWVRIATAFGDVILAPNGRAAERAAQRHPNLPIFRPNEWKELLACETHEELAVLIELKRTLGADLIRAEPVEREGVSP